MIPASLRAAVLLLVSVSVPVILAQTPARQAPDGQKIDNGTLSGLTQQFEYLGSARIIVQLRLEDDAGDKPLAISRAQDRLLEDLANTSARLLRRYHALPMVALEVEQDALEHLLRSPLVESISADSLSHTSDSPGT